MKMEWDYNKINIKYHTYSALLTTRDVSKEIDAFQRFKNKVEFIKFAIYVLCSLHDLSELFIINRVIWKH